MGEKKVLTYKSIDEFLDQFQLGKLDKSDPFVSEIWQLQEGEGEVIHERYLGLDWSNDESEFEVEKNVLESDTRTDAA